MTSQAGKFLSNKHNIRIPLVDGVCPHPLDWVRYVFPSKKVEDFSHGNLTSSNQEFGFRGRPHGRIWSNQSESCYHVLSLKILLKIPLTDPGSHHSFIDSVASGAQVMSNLGHCPATTLIELCDFAPASIPVSRGRYLASCLVGKSYCGGYHCCVKSHNRR